MQRLYFSFFILGMIFLSACGSENRFQESYSSILITNIKQRLDKIASSKVEGSSTYSYDVIITTEDERQAWNMGRRDKLLAIDGMKGFEHHFGGRDFPDELYVITFDMLSMEDGRDFTSKKVLKGLSYYILVDVFCHTKDRDDGFKNKLSSIVNGTQQDYEEKYLSRLQLYHDNGLSVWDDLCYVGEVKYDIPADSVDSSVTPVVELNGMNAWSQTSISTVPATIDMKVDFNLDKLEEDSSGTNNSNEEIKEEARDENQTDESESSSNKELNDQDQNKDSTDSKSESDEN